MAAQAHEEAQARLDRVDKLPVGAGQLDLSAYLRGNTSALNAGLQAEYAQRVRKNVSVFGQGWAGTSWTRDTGYDLDYGVLGGLRWTF